jgi:hypothetical protein
MNRNLMNMYIHEENKVMIQIVMILSNYIFYCLDKDLNLKYIIQLLKNIVLRLIIYLPIIN